MSDTTTITPEERARLREQADKSYLLPLDEGEVPSVGFDGLTDDRVAYIAAACNSVPRLLTALEAAEARAEKAESDKAALEEDLEATEKNLKESSGFIEELLSGLKHRFPVQYVDLEGDEYGDDAFSSHDLFELVIDPAVNAAQKAEIARLQKMVDWLAEKCTMHCHDKDSDNILCSNDTCDTLTCWGASGDEWKESARRAVADAESSEKVPCPACKGKGGAEYEPGLLSYVCNVCGGTGQTERRAVAAGAEACQK